MEGRDAKMDEVATCFGILHHFLVIDSAKQAATNSICPAANLNKTVEFYAKFNPNQLSTHLKHDVFRLGNTFLDIYSLYALLRLTPV